MEDRMTITVAWMTSADIGSTDPKHKRPWMKIEGVNNQNLWIQRTTQIYRKKSFVACQISGRCPDDGLLSHPAVYDFLKSHIISLNQDNSVNTRCTKCEVFYQIPDTMKNEVEINLAWMYFEGDV